METLTSMADRNPKNTEDAFSRILRLMTTRERCSSELRALLEREGYRDEDVEEALSRAIRLSLVDDGRYAAAYVRGSLAKGEGSSGIRRHLLSCDIPDEDIETAFDEAGCSRDDETEVLRALSLLERKKPSGKNIRDKAYRTLVRRGFDSSVSCTAARLWCDRMGA